MSTALEPGRILPNDSVPTGDVLYELVDGKLVEKDVSAYAAWIATILSSSLLQFCREHTLGTITTELVFILDSRRKLRRRPDVAFVSPEKWPVGTPPPPTGDWDLIPDIAVEVTNPHEGIAKVMRKVREYFRYGVTEVWVIVPEGRFVQVYRSLNDMKSFDVGEEIRSERIPGWSMPVTELLPHDLEAEVEEV